MVEMESTSATIPVGFKQTEIGLIPEEWMVKPIGELLQFKNGLNKAKEFFGFGTAIINYMDVFTHSGISVNDIEGKVAVTVQEKSNYSTKRGDVFFTRTSETVGEIGISAVLLGDLEDGVFSGFVLRGRPFSNLLTPNFSKYCFGTYSVRKQIISSASYTTRALTNGRLLSRVNLMIPSSIDEQYRISETITDSDSQIQALELLISKKRDIKQGTMQELLTGKTRLPGFGDDWITVKISDITKKIMGGGTPSRPIKKYWKGNVPWVTVKDFSKFDPEQTIESITELGLLKSSSNLVEAGVLIISTRMAIGKAVIYSVNVAINQDLKAVYFHPGTNPRWIFYWFNLYEHTLSALGSGSTVDGISLEDLRQIEIFYPSSVEEQGAIAVVLSDMDKEIATLEKRLEKAKAINKGIMQQLLTGRIRLVEPSTSVEDSA